MTSADVRDAVRDAAAARTPLRIAGGGAWLDAGRPVTAVQTLSLSSLIGIVHYEPGDFTLTARAGTTLDELSEATLPHQQFLALDPFGPTQTEWAISRNLYRPETGALNRLNFGSTGS